MWHFYIQFIAVSVTMTTYSTFTFTILTVCVWGWPHMPRLRIRLGKGPESINWVPSQKLQLTFLALPRLSVDLKIHIYKDERYYAGKKISHGKNIKLRALAFSWRQMATYCSYFSFITKDFRINKIHFIENTHIARDFSMSFKGKPLKITSCRLLKSHCEQTKYTNHNLCDQVTMWIHRSHHKPQCE